MESQQLIVSVHPLVPEFDDQKKWVETLILFCRFCRGHLRLGTPIYVELLPRTGHQRPVTTGGYDPRTGKVYSRLQGRGLSDVLRTVAHELVHQRQHERNDLEGGPVPDIGGLIEDEANAVAGRLLKMFVLDYNCRWIHEA